VDTLISPDATAPISRTVLTAFCTMASWAEYSLPNSSILAMAGSAASSSYSRSNTPGAVRHRNHLGVMSANTQSLTTTTTMLDLTTGGTPTWGTDARKPVNGVQVMWTGNTRPDAILRYTGSNNDRDPILVAVGGSVPTATLAGYRIEDTNLDGLVKYAGSANDRDMVLVNIGGAIPTSTRTQQLP